MERKDITIIYDKFDELYNAIPSSGIIYGYLHDTYGNYGQKLEGYEVGDYTFGDNDFDRELEKYLRDNFDVLADSTFYFCEKGIFDYDVELTDEQVAEINKAISDYVRENEIFVEAQYFNYWDGSNYKSIVFSIEAPHIVVDEQYEIVDDELADEIYVDFQAAVPDGEKFGVKFFKGKNYLHTVDNYQSNPFIFQSYRD